MYYAAIFAGLPARRGPSVDDGAGPGYTAAMAPSRLIPILVLLAAAACENALPTGGPACPHDEFLDRQVPFNVVVSSVPTLVRRDLDIEALSRIRNAERLGPGKLQGLTVVEHRLGYNTGVAVAKGFLRPRSCAWLESLTVDLTPGEVTIYVPREYAEGSCRRAGRRWRSPAGPRRRGASTRWFSRSSSRSTTSSRSASRRSRPSSTCLRTTSG